MKNDKKILTTIFVTASLLLAGCMVMMQNAEAATFGADVRVNDSADSGFMQSAPDMAIDGSDNIFVVWEDNRNGNLDIYISTSTVGGDTFGTDIQIDDDTANQQNPAIATRGSNTVYVAWQDYRYGNWDIFFAKSTNGGASFGPPVPVSDAGGVSEQSYPDIAVAGNDNIHVVWQDYRIGNWDIYSAVSTDEGDSFDANVRVNSNPSPAFGQKFPSVAVNSADAIFVAWQDDRNGDDIYSARSTNDGDSFQTEIKVSDNTNDENQRYPALAIDDLNNIYVAWEDYRNGDNWDIYSATSINNGNSFGTNVRVNDDSNYNQRRPSTSVDADDNLHVTWHDSQNNHVYYTKSTDTGDSFGTDARVCNTNGVVSSQYPPIVGVNSVMYPYIAWADSRNGNDDIYFSSGFNNEPAIAITSPVADATVSGSITISGTASDPDGSEELVRVEVRIDSGSWNTAAGTSGWSYSLNTNSLTDGQHTIYARSFDGDLYSSIDSVAVNVNNPSNLPPVVSIWTPTTGSALSGSEAVVAGNATDPDGDSIDFVQVKIDGGNWIEARGTNGWAAWVYSLDTTTLSNGQHTIYARSYDGALYSDISSVSILVANAGGNAVPAVSIEEPVEGERITENYIIRGTATDTDGNVQLERVQIRIDDGSWEEAIPVAGQNDWTAWVYYLDIGDMTLEEHTIHARAFDGVDHSTEDSVTVTIAEPDAGNDMLWLFAVVILFLLLLLLLALLKIKKDKPTEFQPHGAQQYQGQEGYAQEQPGMPPEQPPSDMPSEQPPPSDIPPPEGPEF